jgi:hypothetical protein
LGEFLAGSEQYPECGLGAAVPKKVRELGNENFVSGFGSIGVEAKQFNRFDLNFAVEIVGVENRGDLDSPNAEEEKVILSGNVMGFLPQNFPEVDCLMIPAKIGWQAGDWSLLRVEDRAAG